ncbi:hypothetical protein KI387_008586, partial [Taxus chinensis]
MHVKMGVQHIWSFTEAGHGKGEHDGAGACVKRALTREELKYKDGAKLKDAKSIVEWCTDNMARGSQENSTVCRYFWLIEEKHIANYEDCMTLTGSSDMHSFCSSDATSWAVWTRKLTCFCASCIEFVTAECDSQEWVEGWICRPLTPLPSYQPPQALQLVSADEVTTSKDFDEILILVRQGIY